MKGDTGRFIINTVEVQKQSGFNDCGLFAIAFAFELANGLNPALLCFDQSKMRNHFNDCVKNGDLVSFPQTNVSFSFSDLSYNTVKFNV